MFQFHFFPEKRSSGGNANERVPVRRQRRGADRMRRGMQVAEDDEDDEPDGSNCYVLLT